MKAFFLILISTVCISGFAQSGREKGPRSLKSERIEASQVPDVVKNKFEASFTGVVGLRWEKHVVQEIKSYTSYVAIFTEGGVRSRARFKEDGAALSSIKYFGPQKLPSNIKTVAKEKNKDFIIMGGEEITTRNGKTFYRVRSRKGSSKLIQYFDENGIEISKDKTPDELLDGEAEEGN